MAMAIWLAVACSVFFLPAATSVALDPVVPRVLKKSESLETQLFLQQDSTKTRNLQGPRALRFKTMPAGNPMLPGDASLVLRPDLERMQRFKSLETDMHGLHGCMDCYDSDGAWVQDEEPPTCSPSMSFTALTDSSDLCGSQSAPAIVTYKGTTCGNGKQILWTSMRAWDIIPGCNCGECQWVAEGKSANWKATWTGGCGVAPTTKKVLANFPVSCAEPVFTTEAALTEIEESEVRSNSNCLFGTVTQTRAGAPMQCCPGETAAIEQGSCRDDHPNMYGLTGFVCYTGAGDSWGYCIPPTGIKGVGAHRSALEQQAGCSARCSFQTTNLASYKVSSAEECKAKLNETTAHAVTYFNRPTWKNNCFARADLKNPTRIFSAHTFVSASAKAKLRTERDSSIGYLNVDVVSESQAQSDLVVAMVAGPPCVSFRAVEASCCEGGATCARLPSSDKACSEPMGTTPGYCECTSSFQRIHVNCGQPENGTCKQVCTEFGNSPQFMAANGNRMTNCKDVPSWNSKPDSPDEGMDCNAWADEPHPNATGLYKQPWCHNGKPNPAGPMTFGAEANFPTQNCCSCGKGAPPAQRFEINRFLTAYNMVQQFNDTSCKTKSLDACTIDMDASKECCGIQLSGTTTNGTAAWIKAQKAKQSSANTSVLYSKVQIGDVSGGATLASVTTDTVCAQVNIPLEGDAITLDIAVSAYFQESGIGSLMKKVEIGMFLEVQLQLKVLIITLAVGVKGSLAIKANIPEALSGPMERAVWVVELLVKDVLSESKVGKYILKEMAPESNQGYLEQVVQGVKEAAWPSMNDGCPYGYEQGNYHTGGSCHFFDCDSSRHSECVDDDCICQKGSSHPCGPVDSSWWSGMCVAVFPSYDGTVVTAQELSDTFAEMYHNYVHSMKSFCATNTEMYCIVDETDGAVFNDAPSSAMSSKHTAVMLDAAHYADAEHQADDDTTVSEAYTNFMLSHFMFKFMGIDFDARNGNWAHHTSVNCGLDVTPSYYMANRFHKIPGGPPYQTITLNWGLTRGTPPNEQACAWHCACDEGAIGCHNAGKCAEFHWDSELKRCSLYDNTANSPVTASTVRSAMVRLCTFMSSGVLVPPGKRENQDSDFYSSEHQNHNMLNMLGLLIPNIFPDSKPGNAFGDWVTAKSFDKNGDILKSTGANGNKVSTFHHFMAMLSGTPDVVKQQLKAYLKKTEAKTKPPVQSCSEGIQEVDASISFHASAGSKGAGNICDPGGKEEKGMGFMIAADFGIHWATSAESGTKGCPLGAFGKPTQDLSVKVLVSNIMDDWNLDVKAGFAVSLDTGLKFDEVSVTLIRAKEHTPEEKDDDSKATINYDTRGLHPFWQKAVALKEALKNRKKIPDMLKDAFEASKDTLRALLTDVVGYFNSKDEASHGKSADVVSDLLTNVLHICYTALGGLIGAVEKYAVKAGGEAVENGIKKLSLKSKFVRETIAKFKAKTTDILVGAKAKAIARAEKGNGHIYHDGLPKIVKTDQMGLKLKFKKAKGKWTFKIHLITGEQDMVVIKEPLKGDAYFSHIEDNVMFKMII